jgi:hypothetical protein
MPPSANLPDPELVRVKKDRLLQEVRHFHDWLRSFHALGYYGSQGQRAL